MKFTCISDTHRTFPIPDKGGDVFIHAGDFSLLSPQFRENYMVLKKEFDDFKRYLVQIRKKFRHVIFVPGNHDFIFENFEKEVREELANIKVNLLINQPLNIDGVKIWGSPITPPFNNWAFSLPDIARESLWDTIPEDTDILVTHGPPLQILDKCPNGNVGCVYLSEKTRQLRPKYHVFGHIHESHGSAKVLDTQHYNVSYMDGMYQPAHDFTTFKIKKIA